MQPEGLTQAGTLPASVLRVFFVVCRLADEGGGISVRRVMRAIGWTSPNHVLVCLVRLRAAGLVSFAGKASKNAGGAHAATIRPLYRAIMFTEKKEA